MSNQHFNTVIFVCTANFFRSRFSECLFNALARERGLNWRATSRGLNTSIVEDEGPLSEFAAYRLSAMGISFDAERFPVQLSETDLKNADLVVAVKKAEHQAMMLDQFPHWAKEIQYWHVDDIDCTTADEALSICESSVKFLVETLLAEQKRQAAPARLRRAA